MPDDLGVAIEKLYGAFETVRLPATVDFCDHCIDPELVGTLAGTPLRQLTSEQLGPLLFNAMSTWGDVEHWMWSSQLDNQFWLDVDRWPRGPEPSAILTAAMDRADPPLAAEFAEAVENLHSYLSWAESKAEPTSVAEPAESG